MPKRDPFREMHSFIGSKLGNDALIILLTDKVEATAALTQDKDAKMAAYPSNIKNHFNLLIKAENNEVSHLKVNVKKSKDGMLQFQAGGKVFSNVQALRDFALELPAPPKKSKSSTNLITRFMNKISKEPTPKREINISAPTSFKKLTNTPARNQYDKVPPLPNIIYDKVLPTNSDISNVKNKIAISSAITSLTKEYGAKEGGKINVTCDVKEDKNGAKQFSFNIYRNDTKIAEKVLNNEELLKYLQLIGMSEPNRPRVR